MGILPSMTSHMAHDMEILKSVPAKKLAQTSGGLFSDQLPYSEQEQTSSSPKVPPTAAAVPIRYSGSHFLWGAVSINN